MHEHVCIRYTAAMASIEAHITLCLPEDIAAQLGVQGDVARIALEGLAVEGYRTGVLSTAQVRRMLGFHTRLQVHEFLKRRQVHLHYDRTELERDRSAFEEQPPA